MNSKETIVIPDVHGRTFWKDAVFGNEDKDIIFLGDYVDPYSSEGITHYDALENFKEIMSFAAEHKDNVTLLLGNHDFGYLFKMFICVRHDDYHEDVLEDIFNNNIKSFSLAAERLIAGKQYIFTHAGIMPQWITGNIVVRELLDDCISLSGRVKRINVQAINQIWTKAPETIIDFLHALRQVSLRRGGKYDFASFLWADIYDMLEAPVIQGCYQVFGHTQLRNTPLITDDLACLDTRRAYRINERGEINPL